MSSGKLSVPLTATQDRYGKKYYIGRIQFPGRINLQKGAVFMVFTSEPGQEEIQIGIMDKKRDKERQAKREKAHSEEHDSNPGRQGNT